MPIFPLPVNRTSSRASSARGAAGSPALDPETILLRSETPQDVRDSPLPHLATSDKSGGFNVSRATKKAAVPFAGTAPDRRFWPRDTRGLLELCEQGFQLQEGMKAHCQGTAAMLENLQGTCETTINTFLEQLQLTLSEVQKQVEKPANIDWTPVFERLQKMQPELEHKIRADQQDTIKRLESQVVERISQAVEEHAKSKQGGEALSSELQEIRQGVRECQMSTAALGESVHKSQELFEKLLSEQGQSLDLSKGMAGVLETQNTIVKQITMFEPMINKHVTKQQEARDNTAARSNFLIDEIHTTLHEDVMGLFSEIGKIQREMNIQFVAPPKTKALLRAKEALTLREMWCQTGGTFATMETQTDESMMLKKSGKKKKRQELTAVALPNLAKVLAKSTKDMPSAKRLFADEEAMKAKMRQAIVRPTYDVCNEYKSAGCAQKIARSGAFENATFLVISLNALWIAVDTDYNDAQLLINAHPVFQVVENAFCSYFFGELLVRFLAFRKTRSCFRDFWFVFDFLLVCTMVIETWIIMAAMLVLGADGMGQSVGSLSILRLVRLVKMFRMARMARLLRMCPELVVILRAIGTAFRSVSFFVLLTAIIIYVFAVGFTQLSKPSPALYKYFGTVPIAMRSLLLDGMLPLYADIVNDVTDANPFLWPVIIIFILLASVTVFNMLIGVLVEVVRTVAATEKEGLTVQHVTNKLKAVMDVFHTGIPAKKTDSARTAIGKLRRSVSSEAENPATRDSTSTDLRGENPGRLERGDFEKFLLQADVAMVLQEVGVDVIGLVDVADMIYEEKDEEGKGLLFIDFIDVVLNMRGTNPSTVKDMKQQIRVLKTAMKDSAWVLRKQMTEDMEALRMEMMEQLIEIRKNQLGSEAGSDFEATQVCGPWAWRHHSFDGKIPFSTDTEVGVEVGEVEGRQRLDSAMSGDESGTSDVGETLVSPLD